MYDDIKLSKSGKAKSLVTDALVNIIRNLEFIKEENITCNFTIDSLIQDIDNLIEWYSRVKTKNGVLDYIKDYMFIDSQFGKIVDSLDSTKYYYNLCLVEGRFKVFRI